MREVVLDTETTGLNPLGSDRLVEIGCIELHRHVPTGETYHCYIDPERDMPDEAFRVHGLSMAFLAGKPIFAAVADEFLAFIGDAPLVIHNAAFDMGFINAELTRSGRQPLPQDRAIDTVTMARRRFPGAQASLDALCRRFNIDLSVRTKHGALLDAQLLAEVYLELTGGRQPDLHLAAAAAAQPEAAMVLDRAPREPRPHAPSPAELAAHARFIAALQDPIWQSANVPAAP